MMMVVIDTEKKNNQKTSLEETIREESKFRYLLLSRNKKNKSQARIYSSKSTESFPISKLRVTNPVIATNKKSGIKFLLNKGLTR